MSGDPLDAQTISIVASDRRPASRPNAQLRVVHPSDVAQIIRLDRPRVVLGRNPTEDPGPPLRHGTVSRQHVAVEWSSPANSHLAKDLGSRNGSWVDGAKMGTLPAALSEGTVLRIGDVLTVYETASDLDEDGPGVSTEAIFGDTPAIRALRAAVSRAAPDPSPVMVVGETGTGKELIAGEIHRVSQRRGDLVALNCAALSAQLIESQLFGHVKGAFTGATTDQPGLFRAADKGSLFLDEIGEMPAQLQPKLLRAIQQGEVIPVGASKPIRVDVRVIAATNRDLADQIERGAFRRDLYARLALWELRVPALRRRRGDILAWVGRLYGTWLDKRPERQGQGLRLKPSAAEVLLLSAWPENLRGIDRLVHDLATRSDGDDIGLTQLPDWLDRKAPDAEPEDASHKPKRSAKPDAPNRQQLLEALEQNDWSVRATAKQFERDRRQIYRWMDAFGIEKPEPKS